MTAAEQSVGRLRAVLAELRVATTQGGVGSMVADLDRMELASRTLLDQLVTLSVRAATAPGPEELRRIRHDLRTPVGQLLGYCELLSEEAEDAGDHRWDDALARARGEVETLRAAIDDLAEIYTGPASADTGVYRTQSLVNLRPGPPGLILGEEHSHTSSTGTILVVDDNKDNRDLLERRLSRHGYAVLTAEHGRDALDLARVRPVDVVLLDIMMPVMDGYQTLAAFKADPELRHVPVIMLSSLDDQGSISACIEAGAEDHLPKPFDPVLLRARLSGSLEKKRARDREREFLRRILAEKKRVDALIHGVIPIGVALSGEQNEARILERTLAEARHFCGADGGMLLLREGDGLFVVQMQCESLDQNKAPTSTRPPTASGGLPGRVSLVDAGKLRRPEVVAANTGQTITIDRAAGSGSVYDLTAVERFDAQQGYRTRSLVYVPLRAAHDGPVCGVLQMWNPTQATGGETVAFDEATVQVLQSLSSLAAAALQAYRREHELRRRIRRLEIKIDERERRAEVEEITATDYFKRLRATARKLRRGDQ